MELNDLVYKKIVKLSEQGDELADNFKYDKVYYWKKNTRYNIWL